MQQQENNSQDNVTPLTHLVIIPDGNRRWATNKKMQAWQGHRKGADNTQEILETVRDLNIKYLTLWGFSTENWKRSQTEVDFLLKLFIEFIKSKREEIIKNKIRFRHIGRKDRLPKGLVEDMLQLENETKDFTDWNLQAALDYGGRDELIRAIQHLARDVKDDRLRISEITEEIISSYLDTKDIPDPDLIIRTSGEMRLSGLMPFQGVYAELYFTDKYYPEFGGDDLKAAVDEYYSRKRRFGGS